MIFFRRFILYKETNLQKNKHCSELINDDEFSNLGMKFA